MNRQLFTLALTSMVVVAKQGKNKDISKEDEARFVKFAAELNKDYRSTEELVKHENKWKQSDDIIKAHNEKAAKSGKKNAVKLRHNMTSDMEDDEFKAMMGIQADDAEIMGKRAKLEKGKQGKKGRKLAASIDHAALGNMIPVKNQYDCGSCWAFTANSVLEGTIAAMSGNSPVALSE